MATLVVVSMLRGWHPQLVPTGPAAARTGHKQWSRETAGKQEGEEKGR